MSLFLRMCEVVPEGECGIAKVEHYDTMRRREKRERGRWRF